MIELRAILMKYKACFSRDLKDLGFTNAVQMEIKLTDEKPVVYRPYRLSFPEREKVRKMVQEMVDANIVTESNSSYASPILLVKKRATVVCRLPLVKPQNYQLSTLPPYH